MIPLKKAKGRVLFNFPGTSRQPAKTTIEGQCSPSPFLCVEARKTIKRQVSQFQRHLQTFYAPLSFSLSLSLFSSVLVCVCVGTGHEMQKFLPIESYVSRSRSTETTKTRFQVPGHRKS